MEGEFTVFEYLYRDAGNYKAWGSLLLAGIVSGEDEAAFRECLDSGTFFIAQEVGIPALNRELWKLSGGPTDDDHGFHEFYEFRLATPEDLKREKIQGDTSEFLERFRAVLKS